MLRDTDAQVDWLASRASRTQMSKSQLSIKTGYKRCRRLEGNGNLQASYKDPVLKEYAISRIDTISLYNFHLFEGMKSCSSSSKRGKALVLNLRQIPTRQILTLTWKVLKSRLPKLRQCLHFPFYSDDLSSSQLSPLTGLQSV